MSKRLRVLSPAKVNLTLQITGRRNDGYHLLDSLVAFTDFGDEIHISHAENPEFSVEGPFFSKFSEPELSTMPNSQNLAIRALWSLARTLVRHPDIHIHLIKNLPFSAGIGGGSSNAATVLWAVQKLWGQSLKTERLHDLMMDLGADVPVCYHCDTARIIGTGELQETGIVIPEMPILLINPLIPCPSADIFKHYVPNFRTAKAIPPHFETFDKLIAYMHSCTNDLTNAAQGVVPTITNILHLLNAQQGCRIARLSGSGATCFGLFDDQVALETAQKSIQQENPDWWIKSGYIGRVGRY